MTTTPRRDLTGQRFGRWTAVTPASKRNNAWDWICWCECGERRTVGVRSLLSGRSRSCGCLHNEQAASQAKRMGDANRRHGLSRAPEHKVWDSMIQRCTNPNAASFHRYGGRGITVCARWLVFENFIADMGKRPSDELSIDRIDNDGNYEPSNCRWATRSEQALNRPQRQRSSTNGRFVPQGV